MRFAPRPLNPPLRDWRGRAVWLVGASSGIGLATARALHAAGAKVALSARGQARLAAACASLPGSLALQADVTRPGELRAAFAQLHAQWGAPALVLYCAGRWEPLHASALSAAALREHMEVNYLGATQLLEVVLPTLLAAGCGHVSLMASVAGYRGLPKALAYGPTKAALNNLAEILYLDLHDRGLGVSVINPGFVDTPMTAGNDFAMPALMQPDAAARAILAGWAAGRFEMHFPRRFTLLMKLLRHLGERSYFFAVRRVTQP